MTQVGDLRALAARHLPDGLAGLGRDGPAIELEGDPAHDADSGKKRIRLRMGLGAA